MNESTVTESKDSDVLPIEQQKIKGKIKHIVAIRPALDERWVSEKEFGFYVFPPCKLLNGSYISGAKEAWLLTMSSVLDDIWWLCELQYHKFWSQILYDKNAMNGINSFLHLAPLQRLYCKIEDVEVLTLYKRIKKAVFQFLKRISRPQESEMHFMSDEKYSEIMSEYDPLPVSLMFCICTIYGRKRTETVRGFISQLFASNRNLKFDQAVFRTVQLFGYLKKRLKLAYRELRTNLSYSDDQNDVCDAANSYRKCLLATSQFLANAAINISSFLFVFEEGCHYFLDHDFHFHIIRVYKKLLIPVCQEIDILFGDSCHHQTYAWLSSVLNLTRLELIRIFNVCLKTMIEQLNNSRVAYDIVQRYVKLMKLSSKTKEFIRDLANFSSIQDITEKVKKICPGNVDLAEVENISQMISQLLNDEENEPKEELKNDIHRMNTNLSREDIFKYVKECYDSDGDSVTKKENLFDDDETDLPNSDFSSSYSDWSDDQNSNSEYECYLTSSAEEEEPIVDDLRKKFDSATMKLAQLNSATNFPSTSRPSEFKISQIELQSAISHVKDLLPHLGDGFVAVCLEYYKMDTSAVINNVLEDSLPAPLKSIDFSLATIPLYIYERVTDSYETISCSVTTGDEKALKELKKPEYTSYKEMLNDKNEIRNSKTFYEKFRNVEEDELYNDDVDEDYDEHAVAPIEIATEGIYDKYSDFPERNPNRVHSLQDKEAIDTSEEEDLTFTEKHSNNSKKPLDFCENPEDIRARREHHRNLIQQRHNQKLIYRNKNLDKKTNDRRNESTEDRRYKNNEKQSNEIRHRSGQRTKNFKGNVGDERHRRCNQYEGPERGNHSKKLDRDENHDLDGRPRGITQDFYDNSSQQYRQSKSSRSEDWYRLGIDRGGGRFNENSNVSYDEGSLRNRSYNTNPNGHRNEVFSRNDVHYEERPKVPRGANRHSSGGENSWRDRDTEEDGSRKEDDRKATDNNTTRERRQKTIFKSRTVNHDRRYLADRKKRF